LRVMMLPRDSSLNAEEARLKVCRTIGVLVTCLASASIALGQSPITSMSLGPDSIGKVRTALGITTRISFPEPVLEIVCGDLYDPASGKGTFVAQPSGTKEDPGYDVFVKPVAGKGLSNMFVTTGKGKKRTYNFDLEVVQVGQAHRIVTVLEARPLATPPDPANGSQGSAGNEGEDPAAALERMKTEAEQQARLKAGEILRNAQQQADRKVAEAEARAIEVDRETSARAGQTIEKRFMQALILGLREIKISKPVLTQKKLVVKLDPSVLLFDDKAYLRYTIQNTGESDFAFGSVGLETGLTPKETQPITIEVNPSKAENKLSTGEVVTGVIVFDPKQVGANYRLAFVLRGEDQIEIARIVVQ
ncbi:MAG TPA: hypothetical protein VLU47_10445, partial [Blastocatellia bacterium]|nr:hypothetical protein [Blastocatellia bacterium]